MVSKKVKKALLLPLFGLTLGLGPALGLVGTCQPSLASPQRAAEAPVKWTSLITRSTCKPSLVKGTDGIWNLVYELVVTNFQGKDQEIKAIEIFDQRDNRLLKLTGKSLKNNFLCVAAPHNRLKLKPGESAVAWINIELKEKPSALKSLEHKITVAEKSKKKKVEHFSLSVLGQDALPISAPLTGTGWLAMGGYNGKLGHRRALMPIGNKLVNAQRYAIDWIKFDKSWHTWKPDGSWEKERDSVCYGEPLLAVTDGEIVGTIDQFKDQPPFKEGTDMRYPGGNCITLKMDNGYYAFYAHIKPGSLKVKTGDRVKRGQVLALLGNSGHSFEPHLHFHITDKPEILEGNGIPYVIENFEFLGEARKLDRYATNKSRKEPAPVKLLKTPQKRANELPKEGAIVRFTGKS